jgi:hypothetical protein
MNARAIQVWLLQTLIVILPLALWFYYVSTRFPVATGINHNFGFPLVAMGKHLRTSLRSMLHVGVDFRYFPLPFITLSILFQACILCAYKETDDPWWRIGALYAALLLVIGDAMWGSWWSVCRVVLPLTISFNLLLKPDRRFWLFYAIANFPIALGIVRFV